MRTIVSAAALAVILSGAAVAQTTPGTTSPGASGATKMSQAECSASWTRLDTAKSGKLSETEAEDKVTNFSSADTDKDGNLSRSEYLDACEKGLVTAGAGTGTGSRGITGSDSGSGSGTPSSPGGTSPGASPGGPPGTSPGTGTGSSGGSSTGGGATGGSSSGGGSK